MKDNRKGLAIAIIVLFVGTGVVPSLSGYDENEVVDEFKSIEHMNFIEKTGYVQNEDIVIDNTEFDMPSILDDPTWQWAVSGGGTGYDRGWDICIDSSGNTYITGEFCGSALFGSTTLTSQGYEDVFVAKLDINGNWQWAVSTGGTRPDCGLGICVDSSGNTYITGVFSGSVLFGSIMLTSDGGWDVFVAKLDSNGNWQWAVSAGGTSYDIVYDICMDSSGNTYITGRFYDSALFGSTTLTSDGGWDVFVAKLSDGGGNQHPEFVYVDDDFNETTEGWQITHFDNIQDGINAVTENGTVYVYNGTYYENVLVDKSINLVGENRETTIIDGKELDHFDVIEIFVDGVMITGFTIKNSGNCWPNDVGIDIRANHTQIIDNIIENNHMGLYLFDADSSIICDNIFRDSFGRDIRLDYHSDNNTIAYNFLESDIAIWWGEMNRILNNTLQGTLVIQKGNNVVRENKLKKGLEINPEVINDVDTSNTINGKPIYYYVNKTGLTVPSDAAEIILVNCHYFTISNHLLLDDAPGIILGLSTYNMITNNVIRNGSDAISLYSSSNNTIIKNDIEDSICGLSLLSKSFDNIVDNNHLDGVESGYWIGRGIQVVNSQQNIIVNNIIQNYLEVGIWLYTDSDFNQIYHNNLIDNHIDAKDECINSWDNSYPSGGNYWDDYIGEDNDGDGVGDVPYNISRGNNQDRYPLMEPYGMTELTINMGSGLFKFSSIIKNVGNKTAFNVQWKITIDGGIILVGRESSGYLPRPLLAGEETCVSSGLVFGFGRIIITVSVWADNAPLISKSIPGFLFLFFIKIREGYRLTPMIYTGVFV